MEGVFGYGRALRFVGPLLDGEAMTDVCREFGISRKTGYKIFGRYKEHGLEALTDRSRRPIRYANQLPPQVESLIVGFKRNKPHWGARKIRELLVRRLAGDFRVPARSTIHAVLVATAWSNASVGRASVPPERRCRGRRSQRSVVRRLQGRVQARRSDVIAIPLPSPTMLRASCCCAKPSNQPVKTWPLPPSSGCFAERGLPLAIRSDNGVPFASPNALFNLSKLSVWWLRLGISIERIKPGHPQQNGRHERMHLTLKKEATRPPGMNSLQQQGQLRRLPARVQHRATA